MIFDFTLSLDVNQVFRSLGYQQENECPQRVRQEVELVLGFTPGLMKAKALCTEISFSVDYTRQKLLLPKGHSLGGKVLYDRLKQCTLLVAAVGTLGEGVAPKRAGLTEDKDNMLRTMVWDTITNLALFELDRQLRCLLSEKYAKKNLRLAACFNPGDDGLGLEAQKTVFDLVDTRAISVVLNEHYMMKPLKTISALYGLAPAASAAKTGIGGELEDRNCVDGYSTDGYSEDRYTEDRCTRCGMTDCTFRRQDSLHQVIIRTPELRTLRVPHGQNLYHVLVEQGIVIPNSCGGQRLCGQCLIKIAASHPLPLTEREAELLRPRNTEQGVRLACFTRVEQDMEIWLPDVRKAQVYTKGENEQGETVPRSWLLSRTGSKNFGVAVDLGTTTIVLYLLDVNTGLVADLASFLNPQRAWGADVISRINYTLLEKKGLEALHCQIIEGINGGLRELLARNALRQEDITKITVAGNTAMIHLFLAIPCINLAKAPYEPVLTSAVKTAGSDLGLSMKPSGQVIVLPGIAAFMGSDTLAAVLASGMHVDSKVNLLIDIGTNGEIVLGNRDMMLCCSTAAGPAFEGGRITCGTGGVSGAIDHVSFDKERIYSTIYDQDPVGICGSGIVDIVAELLRYGIVDKTGKMKRKNEMSGLLPAPLADRLIEHQGKTAFLLDKKAGIVFTQADVREFQLAKGAILAGINMLLNKMGVAAEALNSVYLAGGFGNYLDLDSAKRVGLFPAAFHQRLVPIGNGAGTGAKMALLSDDSYRTMKEIQGRLRYWELAADPEFQNEYIKALDF